MVKETSPRLHAVLARDVPFGVVIRRGPSKHTCTVGWNRATDEFEIGQWFKGRVYERRCDISPDGKFLLYFAMNGKWQSDVGGSWTAISRAPWLKAIELHPKGDCWEGGGLFLSERSYWLNDRYYMTQRHGITSSEVTRITDYEPPYQYGGECPGVYYLRLRRDGWKLVEHRQGCTVFEKLINNDAVLRKIAQEGGGARQGKPVYWDEHEIQLSSGKVLNKFDWEWAESDGKRVMWAAAGCLFTAESDHSGKFRSERLLRDFRSDRFENIPAPY